ncbi:MAG: M15 family metallopeptidase [Nitrospira sp.]
MYNPLNKINKKVLLVSCLSIVIVSSISFDGFQFWTIREKNISLENKVTELEKTLQETERRLSLATNENLNLSQNLQTEQQNNIYIQDQIQSIAGTVGVLEKLSKTDTEFLKKYSKVFFLNENYVPAKLTDVDSKYLNIKDKTVQIYTDVWPHLQKLLDSAEKDGVTIQILSGYRSFKTQSSLKNAYKITYGAGTANKFSADQGYSEHQLGTTVDFTTPKTGQTLTGFEKTDAYKWLVENAYRYGFTMSYPKENTYYIFEPWHFRFVGVELATRLHEQNIFFYAMDQRDIDTYLVKLFD